MKYPKTGVGVIFIDNNKILLGRRVDDNTWGLVGGKIEWMESFEDCAIRESKEEVNLIPIELEYIGINKHEGEDVGLYDTVLSSEDYAEIIESE